MIRVILIELVRLFASWFMQKPADSILPPAQAEQKAEQVSDAEEPEEDLPKAQYFTPERAQSEYLYEALSLRMTPTRVENCTIILKGCAARSLSDNHIIYVLATAAHESGLLCVRERKADEGSEVWMKYQSKYWAQGFYGRGFAQLTHESNYIKFGQMLGIDLRNKPKLALDPVYAAQILLLGMLDGHFTGLRLIQFVPPTGAVTDAQWLSARKTINGTFHADKIALKAAKLKKLATETAQV